MEAGPAAGALEEHAKAGGTRLREWCQGEMLYNFDGGKMRAEALAGGQSHTFALGRNALEQGIAEEENLQRRIAEMDKAAKALTEYEETRGRMLWLMEQGAEAKAEVEAVPQAERWWPIASAEPFIAAMRSKAREIMQPPGALFGERPPSARLQQRYSEALAKARAAEHISAEDIERFFRVGGLVAAAAADEEDTQKEEAEEDE